MSRKLGTGVRKRHGPRGQACSRPEAAMRRLLSVDVPPSYLAKARDCPGPPIGGVSPAGLNRKRKTCSEVFFRPARTSAGSDNHTLTPSQTRRKGGRYGNRPSYAWAVRLRPHCFDRPDVGRSLPPLSRGPHSVRGPEGRGARPPEAAAGRGRLRKAGEVVSAGAWVYRARRRFMGPEK